MSLITLVAVTQALAGLACLFAPDLLAGAPASVPFIQLLSAAQLGFAALNWLSRGSPLGGIYGRPITVANFVNFFVGGRPARQPAALDRPGLLRLWPAALHRPRRLCGWRMSKA